MSTGKVSQVMGAVVDVTFEDGNLPSIMNALEIERENDELEIELRHSLFQCEKEYDPIDMVFLYDIINKIGSLADISQTVGHLLVRLISR